MFLLRANQKILLEIDRVVDDQGHDGGYDAPMRWTSSDRSIIEVKPSVDGNEAEVMAVGNLGTARVSVRSGKECFGYQDFEVIAAAGKHIKMKLGKPEVKPVPPPPTRTCTARR